MDALMHEVQALLELQTELREGMELVNTYSVDLIRQNDM